MRVRRARKIMLDTEAGKAYERVSARPFLPFDLLRVPQNESYPP